MKKVLWFSRHEMTPEQKKALGIVEVLRVNGTMQNVHSPFMATIGEGEAPVEVSSFKELISNFDIIAIVAPINLQQQVLSVAQNKPVIIAKNKRVMETDGSYTFEFEGWEQLISVEVKTKPYAA